MTAEVPLDLAELRNDPPALAPWSPFLFNETGPHTISSEEGKNIIAERLSEWVQLHLEQGRPFCLRTYNVDNKPIDIVWDGTGDPEYRNEHTFEQPGRPETPPFVTCKWYTPSEEDLTHGASLPEEYGFNRVMVHHQKCNNPAMNTHGMAVCGSAGYQPNCSVYEPDPLRTTFRAGFDDGHTEVLEAARLMNGIHTIQHVSISEGVRTLRSQHQAASSEKEKQMQRLQTMILESDPSAKECTPQPERHSFLKGLLEV